MTIQESIVGSTQRGAAKGSLCSGQDVVFECSSGYHIHFLRDDLARLSATAHVGPGTIPGWKGLASQFDLRAERHVLWYSPLSLFRSSSSKTRNRDLGARSGLRDM